MLKGETAEDCLARKRQGVASAEYHMRRMAGHSAPLADYWEAVALGLQRDIKRVEDELCV